MRIRELFPSETALVTQFYREAPDYWLMAEGRLVAGTLEQAA